MNLIKLDISKLNFPFYTATLNSGFKMVGCIINFTDDNYKEYIKSIVKNFINMPNFRLMLITDTGSHIIDSFNFQGYNAITQVFSGDFKIYGIFRGEISNSQVREIYFLYG